MKELKPKLTEHPGEPKSILERVYRGMVFSAKDWGTNAFDIALCGIVSGWDEDPEILEEFKEYGITSEDVKALNEVHKAFIEIQNKYYR